MMRVLSISFFQPVKDVERAPTEQNPEDEQAAGGEDADYRVGVIQRCDVRVAHLAGFHDPVFVGADADDIEEGREHNHDKKQRQKSDVDKDYGVFGGHNFNKAVASATLISPS
jgi:hypothetical protein